MAKMSREQAIKKGKQLRALTAAQFKSSALFKHSVGKEVFIDTEAGRVRTLWYGFENAAVAPIFFGLHGGGFILGNPEMDEAMNLTFSREAGCKIISIDYAKAPEFPYPAAVDQVYAVVKHVFENAEEYAIDPARMAIGGHSAGGNLSTVTCMKARQAGEFQFVCQVLDYPPLDLGTSPLEKPQPEGCIPPETAMIFDACYVDPAQAKDPCVSPVYATPDMLAGLPPALFILAGQDSLHDEAVKYCEMLNAAGVVTECHVYPNATHGFTLDSSDDADAAIAKMAAFLKRYLSSPAV